LIKKNIAKIERKIENVQEAEIELLQKQELAAFDHHKLIEIESELNRVQSQLKELENEWLELSMQINA
jgi:hypothetical protein